MKTKEEILNDCYIELGDPERELTQKPYRAIMHAMDEYANVLLPKWISVNDQLPYRDGNSSIYCLVNDSYWGIVVRPFNEAHQCWDGEDGDDYYTDAKGGKITHWMPLPEPPKK